jgi:hypothetical protein
MSASPADSPPPHAAPHDGHLAVRIVRAFIDSKLTPLVVVAAILLGVGAVLHAAARGGAADQACR